MKEEHSKTISKRKYYDLNVENERSADYYSHSSSSNLIFFIKRNILDSKKDNFGYNQIVKKNNIIFDHNYAQKHNIINDYDSDEEVFVANNKKKLFFSFDIPLLSSKIRKIRRFFRILFNKEDENTFRIFLLFLFILFIESIILNFVVIIYFNSRKTF